MGRSFHIQDGIVRKVSEDYYHIDVETQDGGMVAMYVGSLDVENAVVEIGKEGIDVSGVHASYSFSSETVHMCLEF
jgi:hypothetical protein